MSVDLDILSTLSTVICWNDVKDRLKELLGPLAPVLGENSGPVALGTHQALEPDAPFSFEDSYGLNLEIQNTLGIHVWSNLKYPIGRDYFEDYGRNLTPETVEDLLDRCRSAGHHYEIGSFAGRGPHEFQIMAALAVAIAEACQGYVVLMNDGVFDLETGIYTPEQFRREENVEKVSLQSIFKRMYHFLKENQTWTGESPVVESVDFRHPRFGPIRFSLRLSKRFHHGFRAEAFILDFDVTLGNSTGSRIISAGESAKVLMDMGHLCQDIAPLYLKLPQIYMGFDYPRRWEH